MTAIEELPFPDKMQPRCAPRGIQRTQCVSQLNIDISLWKSSMRNTSSFFRNCNVCLCL